MKFTVTEVLVSYIKDKRKENKITVSSFAEKIGKSKSYITKFDNCEFKTLTFEDLKKMFLALCNNCEDDCIKLMDDYFLSLIKNDYIKKNVDLDIDVSNYSNIIKEIPIPENLIRKLNKLISTKNFTIHDIVEYANANEPVKDLSNFDLVEYNEYSLIPVSDVIADIDVQPQTYIKIKLDESYISSILNGETTDCNYFTLLAFANAYYIMELLKSDSKNLSSKINEIAAIAAHNLLFNFQFYSLFDNSRIETNKKNRQTLDENLNLVSHSIQGTLCGYMNIICQIYKQNPFYIEDKVRNLDRNLDSDPAFCIATMDLPFYKVEKLNIDNKKKLLKDMASLIDRYANDEDYQEQLELI